MRSASNRAYRSGVELFGVAVERNRQASVTFQVGGSNPGLNACSVLFKIIF